MKYKFKYLFGKDKLINNKNFRNTYEINQTPYNNK